MSTKFGLWSGEPEEEIIYPGYKEYYRQPISAEDWTLYLESLKYKNVESPN